MSVVLMDVYSGVFLDSYQHLLGGNISGRPGLKNYLGTNVAHTVENLVICDKILLEATQCYRSKIVRTCNLYEDIIELVEDDAAEGSDISEELKDLQTSAQNRWIDGKYSMEVFLQRSHEYLRLADKLGVYFCPHPIRQNFLNRQLKKDESYGQTARLVLDYFDQKMKMTQAVKFIGYDMNVPPVFDHVLAFSKKKGTDLTASIIEIRNSENAQAFRRWCAELDGALTDCSGRSAISIAQKIVQEVDRVAERWIQDLDDGVRYVRRQLSLRRVWGLGKLLETVGLDKIPIKDPVIFPEKPYLLFLNDLYRPPASD